MMHLGQQPLQTPELRPSIKLSTQENGQRVLMSKLYPIVPCSNSLACCAISEVFAVSMPQRICSCIPAMLPIQLHIIKIYHTVKHASKIGHRLTSNYNMDFCESQPTLHPTSIFVPVLGFGSCNDLLWYVIFSRCKDGVDCGSLKSAVIGCSCYEASICVPVHIGCHRKLVCSLYSLVHKVIQHAVIVGNSSWVDQAIATGTQEEGVASSQISFTAGEACTSHLQLSLSLLGLTALSF